MALEKIYRVGYGQDLMSITIEAERYGATQVEES